MILKSFDKMDASHKLAYKMGMDAEQGKEPDMRIRGLTEVLLDREELLDQVKTNYQTHREKFEEAMDGYKAKAIGLLEDHIDRIRANVPEKVFVALEMPEDHSEDYKRVIEMLEWSEDEKLELNEGEFATYVLDQWGWQEGFAQTYALYSGT